ncbi:MAG: ABC transporter ATP-binding protein, partial [Clostridia bacterium]|nr:ABC transporter ATP-binding protein [Clostridia bacterium]
MPGGRMRVYGAPKGAFNPAVFKRLIKTLFKYYKGRVILIMICILLNSIAGIAGSVFLQRVVDDVITPGLTEGWQYTVTALTEVAIQMVSIYLLGLISTFVFTRVLAGVTQGLLYYFRRDMFEGMQNLPIKYFDTHAHGDIMSTYTNDVDAVRQLIGGSLPQILSSALSLVMTYAVMLSYSVWLTVLVTVGVFVMMKVTAKIGGGSARFMMAQQASIAKTEGFIEEMTKGQRVVKVFNHEGRAKEDFDALNDQLFSDSYQAHAYSNVIGPILNNMGNILYVLTAFVGALLVILQAPNISFRGITPITVGIILSFLTLSRQLSQTVNQLSQQIGFIAMGLAGVGRVFALMDEKPEADEGYVTLVYAERNADGSVTESEKRTGLWAWKHYHKADDTVTYTELKGEIELDHVDFGYVPEKQVLYDVTLDAKAGTKVAFVGATGAGKTTITNLINRFYDIQDGKIRYDGINVNKIRKADLRRSLGIVLQDTCLFTGTIMENIRYGNLDATDEECIEAAKLANAHGFIERLPEGYQTVITGNGASLSQGQRQLLAIARAAVADAPAMILDEATSSIDTRTEALV